MIATSSAPVSVSVPIAIPVSILIPIHPPADDLCRITHDRAVESLGLDPQSPWTTAEPDLGHVVGRPRASRVVGPNAGPSADFLLELGVGRIGVVLDEANETSTAHSEDVVASTARLAWSACADQAGAAAVLEELAAAAGHFEHFEIFLAERSAVALGQVVRVVLKNAETARVLPNATPVGGCDPISLD